jgi:dihydroorotase
LPLVQHALLTLMEHVTAGRLSVEQIAHKTAHAPATLFQIKERGFIREGYWADLVVIDPDGRTDVDRQPILSKCGWSPFSGMTFRSSIAATFVNGVLAYQAGRFETDQPGRPLEYQRN